MRLYFDTAYLGKCYWNEPDGRLVRELARRARDAGADIFKVATICLLYTSRCV